MTTITVKIPGELDVLLEMEAKKLNDTKSGTIRRLLAHQLAPGTRHATRSCYDLAKDLCGSVGSAPKDLSVNRRHMKEYGQ